jgi:anti-sigma-K factor RskA
MSGHEQFADDLALYALELLEGEPLAVLEQHLAECPACRRELEHLRGDMALMALSTAGPAPPRRARQRLLAALGREPRLKVVPERRSAWSLAGWLAAAAVAILAVLLWRENAALEQQVLGLRDESNSQAAQLERARAVVETLIATDAMRVTLVAAKTPPQPQGRAIYVRGRGSLIFLASNLPAVPPQKAYELWLIPKSGAPIPAGVFKPDAQGSATVVNPPLPAGTEAKAFAITVEPEAGSSAPTMPIVMVGAGE